MQGNFRNSLDTPYYIAMIYGEHFPHACMQDPDCGLTQGLATMINWLVTLKQIKTYPEARQLAAFQPYLRDLGDFQQADYWRRLPWLALLQKPEWSETFLYVMKELLDIVAQVDSREEDELQSALQRLGFPEGGRIWVSNQRTREALVLPWQSYSCRR